MYDFFFPLKGVVEMRKIECKILDERIGGEFELPSHKTAGSAAIDLVACIDKPLEVKPGDVHLVGSGIAIHINDSSLMSVLNPRSGLGHKKGLILGNTQGWIDSDYTGELKISVWNRSKETYVIEPGERICQMAFVPVVQVELDVVNDFSESSDRGDGGFGHTGRK